MVRKRAIWWGWVLVCALWIGGWERAQATTYDYGTGLFQSYSVSGGAPGQAGDYCNGGTIQACNQFPYNGKISANNSQSAYVQGYNQNGLFGSGTSSNSANTSMGIIHLSSSSAATGSGGSGISINTAQWVDTLTIGGTPDIPLQFYVSLELVGSVSATAGPLRVLGGTASSASVNSSFIIAPTVYGQSQEIYNLQSVCVESIPGENDFTCPGSSPTPTSYNAVLTAYSGETLMVNDYMSLFVQSTGLAQQIVGCQGSLAQCTAIGSSSADALFLDTSMFSLTPLTPGAFYTSASGTNYTPTAFAATPEPSTWALFATGILGLAIRTRRSLRTRWIS